MHEHVKIGFFGGTFDPIHSGHIHLALEAKERLGLHKVFFCPTFLSPFKKADDREVKPEHRLAMVEKAIEPIDGFEVLDYEILRSGISYTIDTLREFLPHLQQMYPHVTLVLILANELVKDFFSWKEPEEILQRVDLAIGTRTVDQGSELLKTIPKKYINYFKNKFLPMPVLEISSSTIRQRLAKGLYCGHLMPREVLDYIDEFDLYSCP